MSTNTLENKMGNYTVSLYNTITGWLHSVHTFENVAVADVIDLAKKEVHGQVDPTGTSQAHIGYADSLKAAVTDTVTGEGVEAPREKTETELLTERLEAAEANLKRYEDALAEKASGVAVEAPPPYAVPGIPQTPSNVPDSPVEAPKPTNELGELA